MGFRSQFESLVAASVRWGDRADVWMVYGREAFPAESRWPAPVPDGRPAAAPRTLDQRLDLVRRFAAGVGAELPFLVDDLGDGAMTAYDAYPFRLFAIAADGTIALPSTKGAAGFAETLERVDAWLEGPRAAHPPR